MSMQHVIRSLALTSAAFGAWVFSAHSALAQSAPVIEQVQPTSGPPGTLVNIVGRRFTEDTRVSIGAQPLSVEASLPNRVSVRIPAGAPSGNITVTNAFGSVRGPEFRLTPPLPPPAIDAVDPLKGPPGTHVTVRGRNFSSLLTGNVVSLAGQPVVVRSASPDELEVIIPEVAHGGAITVRVDQAGEVTSKASFEITTPTRVSALRPSRGGPGAELKILGKGFSKVAKQNRVFLNNAPLPVKQASETELVVQLPSKIASGKVLVDVQGAGRAYSDEEFVVQHPPTILEIVPDRGAPGASITVRGTNFGTEAADIEAKIGDAKAIVSEVRDTSLVLQIPEAAKSDRVSIRVHGVGPSWSKQSLTILPLLGLVRFEPQSGPAGTEVVIVGQGFGDTIAKNKVSIGGQAARVIEASATKLKVRIPKARSGPLTIAVAGNGEVRSSEPFVVIVPPIITAIAPREGPVGTQLKLQGSGFGTNPSAVKPTLAGKPLVVLTVRDDEILTIVPAGSTSGKVAVEIPLQGSSTPDLEFTVLPATAAATASTGAPAASPAQPTPSRPAAPAAAKQPAR